MKIENLNLKNLLLLEDVESDEFLKKYDSVTNSA